MSKFSFHKGERLKKEKLIKELFSKGSSFNLYPYKVIYLLNPQQDGLHQALFTASARNFKKAVDRNKIKRRSKEAYRLRKGGLNETPKLLIGFIYIAKEILAYELLEKAMDRVIESLIRVKLDASGK